MRSARPRSKRSTSSATRFIIRSSSSRTVPLQPRIFPSLSTRSHQRSPIPGPSSLEPSKASKSASFSSRAESPAPKPTGRTSQTREKLMRCLPYLHSVILFKNNQLRSKMAPCYNLISPTSKPTRTFLLLLSLPILLQNYSVLPLCRLGTPSTTWFTPTQAT